MTRGRIHDQLESLQFLITTRLKDVRKKTGETGKACAVALGVTETQYNRLEWVPLHMNGRQLFIVSRMLGVSVDWLLDLGPDTDKAIIEHAESVCDPKHILHFGEALARLDQLRATSDALNRALVLAFPHLFED